MGLYNKSRVAGAYSASLRASELLDDAIREQ